MSAVDITTGEIVESLGRDEAERLSIRIGARLDTMADNYMAVLPMIREAIGRQAHAALGYRSPGEYVADRFGESLSKLGVDVRRAVVQELTAAGLSTRAIAPVVGVSQKTVVKDTQVIHEVSPDSCERPAPITGIDGKTYTRPASVEELAAAAVLDFPELDYYVTAGRPKDAVRLASALRDYDADERAMRREQLAKSIEGDRRRAEQPTPAPSTDDRINRAAAHFERANGLEARLRDNAAEIAALAPHLDELTARSWRNQFQRLSEVAAQIARSIK